MEDKENIKNIKVVEKNPSPQDEEVLDKYFDENSDQRSVSDSWSKESENSSASFPWLKFALLLCVVIILINPFSYNFFLSKISENIYFLIQFVIIAGVSFYVLG